MLCRITGLLILTLTLSGCAKNSSKQTTAVLNLPEMPLAGLEVAEEVEKVCAQQACSHLNDWFNKLYTFKIQYEVYRKRLIINE